MNKLRKALTILAGGIGIAALTLIIMSSNAKAATTGVTEVEDGKTYSGYDITGDGTADTFQSTLTNQKDERKKLEIYVNGKKVFSQERKFDPVFHVKLITLNNGKTFVDIQSTISSDDNCIHKLYQYQSEKLTSVYDFQKYYSNYTNGYFMMEIEKVSGNQLILNGYGQFLFTGSVYWNMKLEFKNDKFEPIGNSYAIDYKQMGQLGLNKNKKWTLQRTIKTYKKAGQKKTSYTLKKGNVIKIYKVVLKDKKVYFKIKNKSGKGKVAYVKCPKKFVWPSYYLKEAHYAG